MKTARFWTGTGLLTVACVMGIVNLAPGYRLMGDGPVEGRVWHRGRPLAGGLILFFPEDRERFNAGQAVIDEQGRFAVDPEWQRGGPGSTYYRICVIPSLRAVQAEETASAAMTTKPSPTPGQGTEVRVLPAALQGPNLPFPQHQPGRPSFIERFADPATSRLVVRLGSGPARIELKLPED
jgi:hypothetical protein